MKATFAQTLAALAVLCTASIASAQAPFTTGKIAPNFSTKNIRSGAGVNLSDYSDSVILVKFFAYW